MQAQTKLSQLQERILQAIAASPVGYVRAGSLYDHKAENLNAARAATSRALARLKTRGLITDKPPAELKSIGRRKPRVYRLTNAEN